MKYLIDNITISCCNPSQYSQTCGYWYTVQNNGMAHTAFARLSSLKRWLEERELKPAEPFPEKHGTHAFIRVEGQYVQSLLMCSEQEWNDIKPIGESIGLQNGDYVEIKFTRDEEGNVVENKLNPNCRWRRTFDYQKCDDKRATFQPSIYDSRYENAVEALEMLKTNNPLRNDRDAYLFAVVEWGLGKGEKPTPEEYGL